MDSLVENITGYVETRIELMKLEMKEEVSKALAKALVSVVIIAVFTLFILLISMAGAYKIGESVGTFGGFAIVAGFYLLIGVLVFLFRGAITEMIEDRVQEKMKKKKN
jgi:sorbitol-specific phosphotransferase system component IIC